MLHNLLRRLETLQEEMNGIREELVDTIKESFDLETLQLDEESVKPYPDDSEEEQEEVEQYPDDSQEEEIVNENTCADCGHENQEGAKFCSACGKAQMSSEEEEVTQENPEDMESPTEDEVDDSEGASDVVDSDSVEGDDSDEDADVETDDVGDDEGDEEEVDGDETDDEDEEESEEPEESDDAEEVDEEEEESVEAGDEKKNSVGKTFADLDKDQKFRLKKDGEEFIKTTDKKITQGKYRLASETNNQKESVIINPKTPIIPVEEPKDIVEPSTEPAGTPGDSSSNGKNTGTSQDVGKNVTSQSKPAKAPLPKLEEAEDESTNKQTVDLTGVAAKEGITAKDVDPEQLQKGKRIEMEHTKDAKLAEKIALDHLAEIPDYYDRLERMEQSAKSEKDEEPDGDVEGEVKPLPRVKPDSDMVDMKPDLPKKKPLPKKEVKKEPEGEKDPAVAQEKKQMKESDSFLEGLVNRMIVNALENVEKNKKA